MKRLVFCFDGTWNDIEMGNPTNVAKISQSISHEGGGVPQIIHYDDGVGTGDLESFFGKIGNQGAGMFGWGLRENIVEAYTFLVFNYQPGDEIYVFGFSRGAFTARSFCGLIRNVGIVERRHLAGIREAVERYVSRERDDSPDTDASKQFRYDHRGDACLERDVSWLCEKYADDDHASKPKIRVNFLGVWDTVGALGLPVPEVMEDRINREYGFHDTRLSKFVLSARHAVAADEERRTFTPSLWTNIDELRREHPDQYDEKIFPGTHSAVGGGGPVVGLSDAALEWVFRGAQSAGLSFDTDLGAPIYRLQPNHRASLHNVSGKIDWSWKDKLVGVGLGVRDFPNLTAADLHESIIWRFHDKTLADGPDGLYRPKSLEKIFPDIEARKPEFKFDPSDPVFANVLDTRGNLLPPTRVESYKVKDGDDLGRITRKLFDGNTAMEDVIFLHNFQIGILFDKEKLYAGRTIEIPFFT